MFKRFTLNPFAKAPSPNLQSKAMRGAGVAIAPAFNGIKGMIPILNATQILKPHATLIFQISELAGVSAEAFQHFYRPAINAFAQYVQQLPASEVHHHATQGGLLTHSLDVCVLALRIRRSYLFSSQKGAEEIAKKQDLWTYAVFLSALCHDLAKPSVQQQVDIIAKPLSQLKRWDSYEGVMDEQGSHYRSAFVQGVSLCQYQPITPLLVHHIIPTQGMRWLNSDPSVFSQWLASISGDLQNSGAIGEIVVQADAQSVSRNLGGGSPLTSTVKPKPLAEKIITSLCHLLRGDALPINCQGGAVWVKGDCAWLASKLTGDRLCAQLILENHADAPTCNSQLFDVLNAHGVIMPCGEKALWQVTISGDDWRHNATVLRIPVSRLWPNSASRPDDFTGEVLFETTTTLTEAGWDTAAIAVAVMPDTATARVVEMPLQQLGVDDEGVSSSDFLPSMNTISQPETIANVKENNQENRANNHQPLEIGEQSNNRVEALLGQVVTTPKTSLPPVVFDPAVMPTLKPIEIKPKSKQDLGTVGDATDDFMAWLQLGIKQRSIAVNDAGAPIHVVPEGVLLVTPNIFKAYATAKGLSDWIPAQKTTLKKKWHIKANGSNIFTYQVVGLIKTSRVNGLLFSDPALIFGSASIPKPNPHLTATN